MSNTCTQVLLLHAPPVGPKAEVVTDHIDKAELDRAGGAGGQERDGGAEGFFSNAKGEVGG